MSPITDKSEKSPNAYTDHEAKAREIAQKFAENVHESLMGEHVIDAEEVSWLVSAIASALREAEERARLTEREACIEILHGLKPIDTDPILDAAKGALDHGIRAIRLQPRAAAIRSRNDE